jgi:hypothetical protein
MSRRKFETFKEVQIEHYKKHPKELKGYLEVALDEYRKDGDEKAFLAALAVAAEVHVTLSIEAFLRNPAPIC